MGELIQTAIIILFVAAAAAYLWRVAAQTFKGKATCCGTTCGKRKGTAKND